MKSLAWTLASTKNVRSIETAERRRLTLAKDLRHVEAEDLKGVDAVVHMAELSNDPAGQLAPTITYEINHKGSVHLAELALKAGVKRFVYMSSCSVYGVSEGDDVTEESCVNPQTAYAICKTLVERDVKQLASEGILTHLHAQCHCLWRFAANEV